MSATIHYGFTTPSVANVEQDVYSDFMRSNNIMTVHAAPASGFTIGDVLIVRWYVEWPGESAWTLIGQWVMGDPDEGGMQSAAFPAETAVRVTIESDNTSGSVLVWLMTETSSVVERIGLEFPNVPTVGGTPTSTYGDGGVLVVAYRAPVMEAGSSLTFRETMGPSGGSQYAIDPLVITDTDQLDVPAYVGQPITLPIDGTLRVDIFLDGATVNLDVDFAIWRCVAT